MFPHVNFADNWYIRSIYELPDIDLLEAHAFFLAFAKFHNIDGHNLECIFTKAKQQRLPAITGYGNVVNSSQSVLIVKNEDMQGMKINDSLRIDGELFVITGISRPISEITRLDLEATT